MTKNLALNQDQIKEIKLRLEEFEDFLVIAMYDKADDCRDSLIEFLSFLEYKPN